MTLRRLVLAAAIGVAGASEPVHAQLRVVNYNIAKLNGDLGGVATALEAIVGDSTHGFAVAPAVLVFQEVETPDVAVLALVIDSIAPPGVTYAQGTFTSSASEDGFGGAQAMFYRSDLLTEDPSLHLDLNTGAGRKADRWRLNLNGYDSPDAGFYIYGAHLKAGNTSSDQQQRVTGVTTLRTNSDALPQGSHIIYCGDFNLYSNSEAAYGLFLAAGNGQAFDPLGTGTWSGAINAIKHSQSPLEAPSGELIGGGLNDRFDFQLSTSEMQDDDGLSLIPATYRSFGNDGMHYNTAINAGNNFYFPNLAYSNLIADALVEATDHIPVVADYQIPGVLFAGMPEDLGRVVQGGVVKIPVTVLNLAVVDDPLGADSIDYQVGGLGGLTGFQIGEVGVLPDAAFVLVTVDTSTVGALEGEATVATTSQGCQNDFIDLFTSGTVVRTSNPSFSQASDVDFSGVNASFAADSGMQVIEIPIWNFGFNSLQAQLDVDQVVGLGPPFSLVGPLAKGIGATGAVISIGADTDGLSAGDYETALSIETSDEDIPGEMDHTIFMNVAVTIGGGLAADINGDGVVGGSDLGLLLAMWGRCPGRGPCGADLNGDGVVDGADLGILLSEWSN